MAMSDEDSKPKNVHYLAKCVLRGSVVLQAVYGHFRSPSSLDVVFGKETAIELVTVDEDGIVQSVCEQAVFGTIKDLAVLHWNDKFIAANSEGMDILVVLSDSGKLSFLTFCTEMHRFYAVTHIQLSEPGNSRHQLGRMLAVDASGSFVAVSAYEDRLALFSVSMSAGANIIDKKILYPPENERDAYSGRDSQRIGISGTIWSMCFISNRVSDSCKDAYYPILAMVLHRSDAVLNELLLLGCDTGAHTVHVVSQYTEAGPLALNIVEVPHIPGFAFLFRVGDALLMDLRDPHHPCCVYRTGLQLPAAVEEKHLAEESCKNVDVDDEGIFNVAASALLELRDSGVDMVGANDPMSMSIDSESAKVATTSKLICSWSWEPSSTGNSKLIFCLDSGELFMMELYLDLDGIKVCLSDCLHRGLPYKVLLWVKGGFIAALAEMGDGLVLKLENGRLNYRSPIQNIAPILDFSVVDYHDEKQDQLFACCGMHPEGSLRIIRSGISVEKLLRTAPIYQGTTGTWTLRMRKIDPYHSFLVLSFVEETRVLTVGLNFTDVTDAIGFEHDACTLACGTVADGLLVQIHRNAVRLCLPTTAAHPDGIPLSAPISTSWAPNNVTISLGAVGHRSVIVATSNPCFLSILSVRSLSAYHYEVYEIQRVKLQFELSCICIPSLLADKHYDSLPSRVQIEKIFAIGTHKPSVEIVSFVPEEGFRVLATGSISLTNTQGAAIGGCVPQDVRLVLVDRLYILSGLRNGMLLRFEWPVSCSFSKMDSPLSTVVNSVAGGSHYGTLNVVENSDNTLPIPLQLIAIRRIGITPVFLVPLHEFLDADVIALSDRPWLLQTARHSLAYTSISFQPATHVTPVCSTDCPNGILFVAENSLHLVEMVHSKRLNVQKFSLGGTPRKVIFHNENRLLLVMRTELSGDSFSSDICCVDPLSGSFRSLRKFSNGETPKCMQLVKVGNEQFLVVGTSRSSGRAMMPSGEAESTKGRLLFFFLEHMQSSDSSSLVFGSKPSSSQSPFCEIVGYATEQLSSSSLCSSPDDNNSSDGVKLAEIDAWELRLVDELILPGIVLSVAPYLGHYVLASAGNNLYVYGLSNEVPQRFRRFASAKTRFIITCLTTLFTRIAVGDCRDGILFYSYQEDLKKLEQLFCDPMQRLVADCALMDMGTAVVSDRKGNVSILLRTNHLEDNVSPECNLTLSCSYYMGETVMNVRKGSFSYKLPVDDMLKGGDGVEAITDSARNSVVATTLLGSVVIFIPITREEHELLEAVQARLVTHPLTAPVLGNDHSEFRARGSLSGVPRILDGDMLAQFLELTSAQQEAVLSASPMGSSKLSSYRLAIPANRVVRLLERVHYALN
ncbi:uncharacterized protein [Aristolochia californica]|uniref:uncharacterized protein isoform X2 n=1 Tax=Aristolochia californica TaxID=171875 RepID=UPI0035E1B123